MDPERSDYDDCPGRPRPWWLDDVVYPAVGVAGAFGVVALIAACNVLSRSW